MRLLGLATLSLAVLPAAQDTRPFGRQPDGTTLVPTQQALRPAGATLEFPGRPTDLVLCNKGTLLAIKSKAELVLVEWKAKVLRQALPVPKDGLSYHGIAANADGTKVYVTGSNDQLWIANLARGVATWDQPIPLPGPKGKGNSAPGGLALAGDQLWVTLSRNNTLGCVDLVQRKLVREIPTGVAPYDVVIAGELAWVSNWGGRHPGKDDVTDNSSGTKVRVDPETNVASSGSVTLVDLAKGEALAELDVGLHPCDLVLDASRERLYVANANSDAVSVLDTKARKVIATWKVRLDPRLPFGSSPNALALSPDGNVLWVCLGTNNAIAALDTATGNVLGALPAGWYPGACLLDPRSGWLFVANTKGAGSLHQPADKRGFNTHMHLGSVTLLQDLTPAALARGLQTVHELNRWSHLDLFLQPPRAGIAAAALPERHGEPSHIEHVVYVIKENRTYDQVLGDLPQGNGDPALCIFGRDVTPNHHALAEEFVLLDNFHCSGVLSADGHQWTNEAYVTDYIEKSFGGFTRSYPFDGDDPLAYAGSGFLWDQALARGRTFRCYGEMVQAEITPAGTWQELWDDYERGAGKFTIRGRSEIDAVQKNLCTSYIGFPGTVSDQYRAGEFLRELQEFERKGSFPNLAILLLPNDHTVGTRPGLPTPKAAVADNDLALGRIVAGLSRSRFWPKMCIFVVEDDPQGGWDHVDAHRTVAFVISPWTRRKAVVSTRYTQIDMVKSIELQLGLPPMNQLDLAAVPMRECFAATPDPTPYTARKNLVPINQLNASLDRLEGAAKRDALASLALDLDDIDRADEDTFNRILWHAVKGHDVPFPGGARK